MYQLLKCLCCILLEFKVIEGKIKMNYFNWDDPGIMDDYYKWTGTHQLKLQNYKYVVDHTYHRSNPL